jgi:hypothetical protein
MQFAAYSRIARHDIDVIAQTIAVQQAERYWAEESL